MNGNIKPKCSTGLSGPHSGSILQDQLFLPGLTNKDSSVNQEIGSPRGIAGLNGNPVCPTTFTADDST